MPTFNFVPRADGEGSVGLVGRRWNAGAFITLITDTLSDGVFLVYVSGIAADHEIMLNILSLNGVVVCDGAGGFSVLSAADVQEAIDVAQAISSQAGLILSDGVGHFSVVDPIPIEEAVTRTHNLQAFATNDLALAGGLHVGDFYRSGGDPDIVCVVH